jgi:hypothetical protein
LVLLQPVANKIAAKIGAMRVKRIP